MRAIDPTYLYVAAKVLGAIAWLWLSGCDAPPMCINKKTVGVEMSSPCARECFLSAMMIESAHERAYARRECFVALCGARVVCE